MPFASSCDFSPAVIAAGDASAGQSMDEGGPLPVNGSYRGFLTPDQAAALNDSAVSGDALRGLRSHGCCGQCGHGRTLLLAIAAGLIVYHFTRRR